MCVCMHAHVQVMETPNAFPLQLLHAHTLVACGRFEEVRLLQCVAMCCSVLRWGAVIYVAVMCGAECDICCRV